MKEIDIKVLNASKETLKKFQEIDLKTQLSSMTFYDAFSNSRMGHSMKKPTSEMPSLRKSKRS